jgi:hypothetical protein
VYWEQALAGFIEVAIAIAGFSGLVAVFGQRSDDIWRATDQLRLRVLLTASASALLFSAAPFIVLDAGVPEATFWRMGSGAQSAWVISIAIYRLRRVKVSGVSSVMPMKIIVPLILLVLLAQIANAARYGLSWVYVVGVAFQLAVAFGAFTGLLLDLWKDDEEAT